MKLTSKKKTGYYLKILTTETKKLLRKTKNKITKDENGENVSHLEITEVVSVHCKMVKNYQHDLRVLCTFVTNNSFGQLSDILHDNFIFLKTFNLKI